MSEKFEGRLFVVKESCRIDGEMRSLGLCTLEVPAEAVEAMGLKPGDQYISERSGDYVLFRKSKLRNFSEKFQLGDPEVIRSQAMYVMRLETQRVRMSSIDYPMSDVEFEFDGQYLFFAVPDDLRTKVVAGTRKQSKTPKFDLIELRRNYSGTAYAVALDGARYGSKQHAMGTEQLVSLLRNAGHRLSRISPRLWSMDGKTAALPDLIERARRIDADAVFVAEAA